MNSLLKNWALGLCAFGLLIACASSGTSSSGGDAADTTTTGAAVAALFSSGGNQNQSAPLAISQKFIDLFVAKARAEGEECGTCDCLSEDPASVDSEEVDPGLTSTTDSVSYGASGDSVTLTQDSFCQDIDGTANTGDTLFAYFSLNSDVEGECTDGSTFAMKAGSEGVWRETDAACPEIYGTFIVTDGTTDTTVNCSITLSCTEGDEGTGVVETATCTDSDGETLSLDSDMECTINAD